MPALTGVDENIGRIINELKRLGLFKNTIVVFTSDHGICMGAHEQAGKDIFYEESMRIPVLISWPEKISRNRPNNHDSFCRLVSDPAFHHGLSATNTGRSTNIRPCFRSPLRKRKQPHCPTLLLHTVIQSGNRLPGITHRYTYVYYPCTDGKVDKIILFDRRSDPYQMNNIAMQHPKLVNRLKSQLKTWLQKTEDPFF